MTTYVVTEGKLDEQILSAVIGQLMPGRSIVVVTGGGKSNAVSLARSLLAVRKEPVAFVVDADTVDPALIQEQRQSFESLLGLVAGRGTWMVALFVPELERCLFRDIGFAERLFGGPLSEHQRVLAEYDPRRVLKELSRERWHTEDKDHAELLKHLSRGDLAPLTEEPALRDMLKFLEEVSERSAA
jgi:hypothetical protein